jgi:hybrid cluster-associated redox disulfide protein
MNEEMERLRKMKEQIDKKNTSSVFHAGMSVHQAMETHPRAREVFAGFHLGGCSHCGISEFETVGQVCEGYGVPVEQLLETLNGLMADYQPTN